MYKLLSQFHHTNLEVVTLSDDGVDVKVAVNEALFVLDEWSFHLLDRLQDRAILVNAGEQWCYSGVTRFPWVTGIERSLVVE